MTDHYLRALLKHLQNTPLDPGVHHVEIRHDSWCALLAGEGPCNCDPEIETGQRVNSKYGHGVDG